MRSTLQVIKDRRSTRKFKSEQIKEEELQAIIEAGIYAPSGHNKQSWNFTVIQNKELIEELNIEAKSVAKNSLDEFMRKMGNNDKFNCFYEAPTVILVSGESKESLSLIDCSAATENMLIAAESLEIGSCWAEFIGVLFDSEKGEEYKRKLNIPQGYTPYHAAVFGYKDVKTTNAPKRKENSVQYIR
ncbi:nitroreductase family protein [Romboutsia weinsteinii]|uniref:Nitroreductase family protein n=1 Tax=Romboutsia weinsteinii TaxID=2020949 RepID=A0A371J3N6_9FIRM|nr:nitroreductase family protein [Romboutsia weinsteinii]RDY27288.1 nitroreductase family protein [Romboutsia weinsteinii]